MLQTKQCLSHFAAYEFSRHSNQFETPCGRVADSDEKREEGRGVLGALFPQSLFSCTLDPPWGPALKEASSQSTKANTLVPLCQASCLPFTEWEPLVHGHLANLRTGCRPGGRGTAGHSKVSCDHHGWWD